VREAHEPPAAHEAPEASEAQELRKPPAVNIFGVVPGQDVFFKGNLDQLKELLAKIGVKANTFFATGDTIEDIRGYGGAALSVVLSPAAGHAPAQALLERDGTPILRAELPVGPAGTEIFLGQIADALRLDHAVAENAVAPEKKRYYSFIERIVDIYADIDFQRYAVVALDSYYAHAVTRFLANDLGWIPHLTAVNDIDGEAEQAEYAARFSDILSEARPNVIFEQNAGLLLEHVRNSHPRNNNGKYYDALSPAYVVGTSIESALADKLGAGFLSLGFPVTNRVVLDRSYVGYRGGLALAEDILTNLVSAR
jgi:nitrogenase molybdenum-iron protein beta chain